jgi:hypothetical protein
MISDLPANAAARRQFVDALADDASLDGKVPFQAGFFFVGLSQIVGR